MSSLNDDLLQKMEKDHEIFQRKYSVVPTKRELLFYELGMSAVSNAFKLHAKSSRDFSELIEEIQRLELQPVAPVQP